MRKALQISAWIFSILFLLCGFIGLFNDPLAGFVMILMGAILLPPLTGVIRQHFGFTPKWWMKILSIFVLLTVFGIASNPVEKPAEKGNTPVQVTQTQEASVSTNTANEISTKNTDNLSANTEMGSTQQKQDQPTSGTLTIHFIDVSQADAILVQLPSGQNILIDGGNNDDGDLVVNYLKQQGIKRLDHVIGTHPHEDHIGGLDVAIRSFEVGKVYLPKVTHNTKTYEDLLLAIKGKGLKVNQAKAGVKLDVGSGIEAVMLAPNSSSYEDLNNYSAVLKLTYGSTSFLFTGDAEAESENEILRTGSSIKSDVLKVGHHGSSSSTTAAFLKAVSPKYAVISVGKGNDYGHPHPETLAKLAEAGVEVFRTDLQGTIIASSDGKTITFNKKASPVKERAPDNSHTTGTSNPVTPPVSVSTSGTVRIERIDMEGEVVTIKNTGKAVIDISGWKLVSEKGNQTFIFPSGTVIQAGSSLKVVSGRNAQAGTGVLVWTKSYIWNNDGDPGALYDANGKLISRRE